MEYYNVIKSVWRKHEAARDGNRRKESHRLIAGVISDGLIKEEAITLGFVRLLTAIRK